MDREIKCGISTEWNIAQPYKEMKDWKEAETRANLGIIMLSERSQTQEATI